MVRKKRKIDFNRITISIFVTSNYIMGNKIKVVRREVVNQKEVAKAYYGFMCALHGIHLTPMQLDLLAHTAIYGTISTPPAREAFLNEHKGDKDHKGTSKASMYNLISSLQQMGMLVKDKNLKIRVRPDLNMSFDKDVYLFGVKLNIKGGENE